LYFSEAEIRELTDEWIFRRAKSLYKDGYVEELEIITNEIPFEDDEDEMIIQTNVISSNGFNSYTVQIVLDNIYSQIRGYCTCSAYEDEEKPCKHITAVLLKYMNEYQNNFNKIYNKSDIDILLGHMKEASEINEEYKRELNLQIKYFYSDHSDKPSIELKLGIDKVYVVKAMRKFLKAVQDEIKLEFGKGFTYDPTIHKFNEVDEKIVDMLIEIMEVDGERNYFHDYYSQNSSLLKGKSVSLTDKLIFRFFKLAKERAIDIVINGKEYNNIHILDKEIPLKFELNMNDDEIQLAQINGIPEPLDENFNVVWHNGSIYLPPKQQMKMYAPIYRMINSKREKKLVFNKKDGEKLAAYVLPALKKVSEEVAFDKELKSNFYEEPLIVKTYLDKLDEFVTASVKYGYGDVEFNPLEQKPVEHNKGILIRDISKEDSSKAVLKSFGFEQSEDLYVMKKEKDIVGFITDGIEKLQQLGEVYYTEAFKNIKVYGKSSLKAGIRLNEENLLEFNFELEGVDRDELKNIFNAIREKKKFFRLKKGGFVALEDKGIQDLADMISFLDIKDSELVKDKILLSKYNALYLDQKIKDKDMDYIKRSKDFRELANNIKDVRDLDYSIPEHLDKIMRGYQKTGFKWFKTLASYGFGGILADEMGLGKTLQTIAFIASEKSDRPSIVIAPTSLVYNWKSEIEKFAPELNALVVSGSKRVREEIMSEINNCDVVITSYPLIRRDIEEYKDINFNYCFIDEAQQIKNPGSQNATSVKEIKAKGYFALTGTPIENSLTELWSIFDFIMPRYMLSNNKFSKIYETPIVKNGDKTALEELNRRIKPFILRRLKKEVIKELPPKIEHKLVVEMTEEQKKLYTAFVSEAKKEIDEEIKDKGFNKSKIKILSVLTRLRQICCDPSVFVEDFKGESGKMTALDEILEESIETGHKILLFSQFTSVLKNISLRLNKNNIKHMYLDGSIKSEDRMGMVKEFNEGSSSVFLISLKAGGTGLNLTGADVVIHFDPWWNPAVEEQATDRAHRIGQKKTVEIIKLLAQGTIEEKIFNLQEKKREIIKSVMNEDMNEDNVIAQFSQEELESLFI
jgi:SNF2 family DNA or RNA helicase